LPFGAAAVGLLNSIGALAVELSSTGALAVALLSSTSALARFVDSARHPEQVAHQEKIDLEELPHDLVPCWPLALTQYALARRMGRAADFALTVPPEAMRQHVGVLYQDDSSAVTESGS